MILEKNCYYNLKSETSYRRRNLKGPFTGMILIELQKAFETIENQILIKKTRYLGFSKNAIAWLRNIVSMNKNLKQA